MITLFLSLKYPPIANNINSKEAITWGKYINFRSCILDGEQPLLSLFLLYPTGQSVKHWESKRTKGLEHSKHLVWFLASHLLQPVLQPLQINVNGSATVLFGQESLHSKANKYFLDVYKLQERHVLVVLMQVAQDLSQVVQI